MPRMYRFFTQDLVRPDELTQDVALSERCEAAAFQQLVKVLRVQPSDTVVLIPPQEKPPFFEFHFVVDTAHKKEVVLKFGAKVENRNELYFGLKLVLCLPNKPDKLSLVLQKAVELGASSIVLVKSDFSQMKHALREERLRKIMIEAAEQSERAVVPELVLASDVQEYLADADKDLLVAMEREDCPPLHELLGDGDVSLLIGPEGGFSDAEKELLRGFRCFTLGGRVLRMETAAIVALGIASTR